MNNHEKSAAFYDTWAERYDAALSQRQADDAVRTAFQRLVLQRVPQGSLLMDFGCGTGTDALLYTEMGYRVLAYDNSPGMMSALEQKGQAPIANGTLTPIHGRYEELLARIDALPRPTAIVSNFAVLNQIEDVGQWFQAMAAYIEPKGWIIVSVLNPYFWWDMRRRWWWQGLRNGRRHGYVVYNTSDGFTTYRHFVSKLQQLGRAVGFTLKVQQSAGILLPAESSKKATTFPFPQVRALEHKWGNRWGIRSLGNFIFLAWQKEA